MKYHEGESNYPRDPTNVLDPRNILCRRDTWSLVFLSHYFVISVDNNFNVYIPLNSSLYTFCRKTDVFSLMVARCEYFDPVRVIQILAVTLQVDCYQTLATNRKSHRTVCRNSVNHHGVFIVIPHDYPMFVFFCSSFSAS